MRGAGTDHSSVSEEQGRAWQSRGQARVATREIISMWPMIHAQGQGTEQPRPQGEKEREDWEAESTRLLGLLGEGIWVLGRLLLSLLLRTCDPNPRASERSEDCDENRAK